MAKTASDPKGAKAASFKSGRLAPHTSLSSHLTNMSKKRRVSNEPQYLLTVYIAGDSPKSRAVVLSLRKLCDKQLPNQYRIKIVDVAKRPEVARQKNLIALPMVVRTLPAPVRRMIGTLTDETGSPIHVEISDTKKKSL